MKILINDGLHPEGISMLKSSGFEVDQQPIKQEDLVEKLKDYQGIIVRSATQVRKEHMDAAPDLKFIGRGGVGLDNIDVDTAKSKGILVFNTPSASSRSVAELAMAHLMGMARFLPMVNKQMSRDGQSNFKELKKQASSGTEVLGKTLGLIGLGRIGREMAALGIGMGMKVIGHDPILDQVEVKLPIHEQYPQVPSISISSVSMEEILSNADFISLHIPGGQGYVISWDEFKKMKSGMGIVNCARGGTIDESALVDAINSEKVRFAATDVFESEPPTDHTILRMDQVGLSPHIGASTQEAQAKVGTELAQQIIASFGELNA